MESNEILAVVDSVSTEKGLEKDVIFKAIEVAIASASQRHFHEDADLYVLINKSTKSVLPTPESPVITTILISLGFSYQELNKIPINKNDKKLDLIITEKKIIQWEFYF